MCFGQNLQSTLAPKNPLTSVKSAVDVDFPSLLLDFGDSADDDVADLAWGQ
jgi:hypothetical protein